MNHCPEMGGKLYLISNCSRYHEGAFESSGIIFWNIGL
jgi:hypothetical protein